MNKYNIIKIILLIYGLSIPHISVLIVMLSLLVLAFEWAITWKINKIFAVRFLLLFLFLISYYIIAYNYGYIVPSLAFKYIIIVLAMYSLGFAINDKVHFGKPERTISILVASIAGITIYALLCIMPYTGYTFALVQLERAVLDYWTQESVLNGTLIGAFGALGLCLLPVLILSFEDLKKLKHGILYIMIILIIIGLYINILMQNRTAFVTLFLSFIICFLIYFKSHSLFSKKTIVLFSLILPIFILFLCVVFFIFDIRDLSIYQRFMEHGLDTERYEAALSMLEALPENYSGGRNVYLPRNLTYVHNLWLDIAYEAGIIPFLLLIFFHVSHFKHYVRILNSPINNTLKLLIMALTVTFCGIFLQEPSMNASVLRFSLSCFMLGVVMQLSCDTLTLTGPPLQVHPL